MAKNDAAAAATKTATTAPEKAIDIPPELLREIADKVYWLLVQRLQIERERNRLAGNEQDMWR